jgi:hypothetical protein
MPARTTTGLPRRVNLGVLRPSQAETYRRVLDALKVKREHPKYSLRRAAREAATSVSTIRRYASNVLTKSAGRYTVKTSDRLRRDLAFYDSRGQFTLTTHSSRQASTIAKYHNAVRAYLIYGDDSALSEFEGQSITVHGKPYPFLTDRRSLNRLARAGELHFLDIYSNGGAK